MTLRTLVLVTCREGGQHVVVSASLAPGPTLSAGGVPAGGAQVEPGSVGWRCDAMASV